MLEDLMARRLEIGDAGSGQPPQPHLASRSRMEQRVLRKIRRRAQRAFFHQAGAQKWQVRFAEKPAANPTGLARRSRDDDIDIHAELFGRRARSEDPRFQRRMFPLKLGQTRNEPAHREGRKRRYVKHSAGNTALDTQRGTRQPVERGPGFGQEIRPGPRRHGVTAGAQEEAGAEPFLQQTNLPAYRAVCQAELGRRFTIAVRARGDFEGAKGIERGQSAHLNRE